MFKAQITELSSTIICSNHAKTTRHSGTLRSSICFSQATIAHEISEIHRNLMKIVEVWCNASLEMWLLYSPANTKKLLLHYTRFPKSLWSQHMLCQLQGQRQQIKKEPCKQKLQSRPFRSTEQTESHFFTLHSQRSDHLSLWGQVCKTENLGIYWQATATTPQLILVKANGLCTLENRFANPRKTPWQSLKSWQKPAAHIRRLQNWPWIEASTEQSTSKKVQSIEGGNTSEFQSCAQQSFMSLGKQTSSKETKSKRHQRAVCRRPGLTEGDAVEHPRWWQGHPPPD